MDKADKEALETWLVLQQLEEDDKLAPNPNEYAWHEIEKPKVADYPSVAEQIGILIRLQNLRAIKIDRRDFSLKQAASVIALEDLRRPDGSHAKGVWFKKISPQFQEVYKKYSKSAKDIKSVEKDVYQISIKDREIWVNNFLLSKPYATGKRFALIDYAYRNAGKRITRQSMPVGVRMDIEGARFTKMWNGLGFRSEILKAFIQKRSKSGFIFRKEVSKLQLQKDGIKIALLDAELQAAHKKNVPE